jgi:hypothetical protein
MSKKTTITPFALKIKYRVENVVKNVENCYWGHNHKGRNQGAQPRGKEVVKKCCGRF